MLDNPAMHLKADMFVQPLTCTPSLPPPSTSSAPLFLDPLTSAEYKISEPLLPSTSSTSLPLHQLTGAECEVPFLSQSTMTIDADMESDDGDIQILDTPALPSPSRSPPLSSTANPFRGSCSPQLSIIPQKRKAIDPDGPQNPEEKFLASLDPSALPEAPAPMVASTSTQPECPVLTVSQQFLEAQTNLLASSYSIKKGEGKDWLTFVNREQA